MLQTVIRSWETLDVRYDGWAATTDERHKHVVQGMLQHLHDKRWMGTGLKLKRIQKLYNSVPSPLRELQFWPPTTVCDP